MVEEGDEAIVAAAMAAAQAGFALWSATPVAERAAALERAGDLIEQNRGRLIALLAKRSRQDARRLRLGSARGRRLLPLLRGQARRSLAPQPLPGPTGESNELRYRGRGVFVCISPWNFPLAIFTGQIAGALAAGNSVVAKPAEQTPLIAFEAVKLLHAAGVPASVLHLVPGDGKVGGMLTGHAVSPVSPSPARRKWRASSTARSPPKTVRSRVLIAETGGINAMIVDATALPEQVTDDVIASAFRSAGQRCSALRLLCVQDDVAERVLDMVEGAARELKLGDPRDPATQVGPVIDAEARDRLERWIADMHGALRFRWEGAAAVARNLCRAGDHRTRSRRTN